MPVRLTILGSGSVGKAVVMGILERGKGKPSQVRAEVVRDATKGSIYPVIHKNIEPKTFPRY